MTPTDPTMPTTSPRPARARRLTAALLAGGLLLGAAGCSDDGDSPADAERAVEDLIEQETGRKVDVDADGGTITVEPDPDDPTDEPADEPADGGGTGDGLDLGPGDGTVGKLPDGWPDDVPVDGWTIVSGNTRTNPDGTIALMAALSSADDVDTVITELGERMEGWTVAGSSFVSTSPRIQTIRYRKGDGRMAGFTLNESGSRTTILLTLYEE